MADSRVRPPAGGGHSPGEGPELTRQEAAEYIASLLEGLKLVAHNAQLSFLAYLITIALEEAQAEKSNRD